jgi:hypothetical protein
MLNFEVPMTIEQAKEEEQNRQQSNGCTPEEPAKTRWRRLTELVILLAMLVSMFFIGVWAGGGCL